MERVLDVYKRPCNGDLPVVCMDEPPKQMINETRLLIEMKPGHEAKEDFEYERCGVANIFLASEPLTGKRYVEVTDRKTKADWAKFIKQIADDWYKDAPKITLVMDNLNTHKPASLYEVYEPKEAKRIWDRFEFVYTPKHGSWLNLPAGSYPVHISFAISIPWMMWYNLSKPVFKQITPGGPCDS